MSCKKDNLKKLSKEDISNVSGGWFIKTTCLEGDNEDDEEGALKPIEFEVYTDSGLVGKVLSLEDAYILADKHNLGEFEKDKCDSNVKGWL